MPTTKNIHETISSIESLKFLSIDKHAAQIKVSMHHIPMLDKLKNLITGDYSQTDAQECEKKTLATLKAYRSPFEGGWSREEEFYFGRMWRNTAKRRPYENEAFAIVQNELPILTDSIPEPIVKANDENFENKAAMLDAALKHVSKDQKFMIKYVECVEKVLYGGPAYIFHYWDARANNGEGRIVNEVLGWRAVWLSGESLIEDTSKGVFKVKRQKEWLQLEYPKYADKIEKQKSSPSGNEGGSDYRSETKDSGSNSQRDIPPTYHDEDMLELTYTYKKDLLVEPVPEEETIEQIREDLERLEELEPLDLNLYQDHKKHIEVKSEKKAELLLSLEMPPEANLDEVYDAISELAEENPEAQELFQKVLTQLKLIEGDIEERTSMLSQNPKGGKLKYPGGYRVLESVGTLNVYDGPIKGEKVRKCIPLTPFYCYKVGPYSHSELRNALDSIEMGAVMTYKIYKGLQRVANPVVLANKASGITKDIWTNEDGAFYQMPDGGEVRHMAGGVINDQLFKFTADRSRQKKDITGINEAVEGKRMFAQESGQQTQKTQDQAVGRIRLKDRINQQYSMTIYGELNAGLIREYWSIEKMLNVQDGKGGYEQVLFDPVEMEDFEGDIEISEGSMAGIDKSRFNALAASWRKDGDLTFKQYVELADTPKKQKLAAYADENDQTQAELEQLKIENLRMRVELDPESITPEEQEILQQTSEN